jgi:enterochelin esterase family protein
VQQSASFVTTDTRGHEPESTFPSAAAFLDRVRAQPGHPAESIYISCGRFESLLEGNRDLAWTLERHGLAVRYEEANDGHHWENWRDRLQSALTWTLGHR